MAPIVSRYVALMFSSLYFISLTFTITQTGVAARPHSPHHTRQSSDPPCKDFFSSDYSFFGAKDAYDCLTSAPFNKDIALEFLQYYSDTLQLQSTQSYLKDPPAGYQQPSVDLLGGLEKIKDQAGAGQFKNEYDFEYALQQLILQTHDAHINLAFGILSIFTFGSPYGLVSVSTDGIALPKVFIVDDLIESQFDAAEWLPSAVVEINGQETSKYLEAFATQNVQGYVEPDADWNNLMSSAAGDIQDVLSNFEGSSIFYPGRENIAFKFENGTSLEDPYLAYFSIYTDPTSAPLIQTGQELYDWFVLGVDSTPEDNAATATSASPSATSSSDAIVSDTSTDTPDSTDTSQEPDATSTVSADPTPTPWGSVAYPQNPIVAQPDLGDTNGGVVTGYVLNDNVTAILSIPSFMLNPENAVSFSTTVQDFLTKSKAAGCTRVIIDLQRNEGGADLLATDTFKQFFPAIDPFGGSRQRAVKFADDLGNTFTQYYDTHLQADMQSPDYITLSASVWVATDYLNAEIGRNFSSWPEYFGPHPDHGDLFTTTSRDNLSSPVFTESAAGLVIYGYANRTATTTQPYPSKDVIILTDAFCTSACARFVEMMQHEGGARTVVAGGRPKTGPMQTVGGNRGAESYDSFSLDSDIDTAIQFNSSVEKQLPQGRDDIEFILDYAGFNLKDAVRKGEDTPLQFLYEPADCRIFYTQNTVYNYVNLWNYVIDAVYRNPSLCIAGSAKPPLPPNSIPPPQGSTIGSLIMKGLSQPQAASDSQPHKRSLFQPQKQNPSKPLEKRAIPFSVPSPTTLHTAQNDRPFDLDTCKKCTGGDICFQAPVCELGKIRTVSTCANKCGKGRPCRDPRFNICHQTSGKGSDVCISRATNDAIRQCGTPTKGTKAQQTQITDPALGNFQFKPGTTRPGRG